MSLSRIAAITKVFVEEGLGHLIGSQAVESSDSSNPSRDRELAARLRRVLERLGPTFVKFGQLLATRIDLFSEDFITELSKLHANVSPFSTDIAKQVIEAELGQPIAEVFADFPAAPVAAASIAQVYRARLHANSLDEKSNATQSFLEVAVKVQRPDIEQILQEDLKILCQISAWFNRLVPQYRKSMIDLIAREYAQRARLEIDFVAEASATDDFGNFIADNPMFVAPRLVRSLCTPRLLVMEWLEGTRLDQIVDADGLTRVGVEPAGFARELLKLQVCMSYEYGLVHADTHPGNMIALAVPHPKNGARIGLIDFGLNATVSPWLRQRMLEMLLYSGEGKSAEQADIMVQVSPPADPADLPAYRRDLEKYMSTLKTDNALSADLISKRLIQGIRIGAKYRNHAKPELLMVIRNLAIVEGIILRYCPTIKPDEEMRQIVRGIFRRNLSFEAVQSGFESILPHLALTLSRRPETMQQLLRLERSFAGSPTLGDFLRKESVLPSSESTSSNPLGLRSRSSTVVFILLVMAIAFAILGMGIWLGTQLSLRSYNQ